MPEWQTIVADIEANSGQAFNFVKQQSLSGGSINAAYLVQGETSRYFVKTNVTGKEAMFQAEAKGLQILRDSATIKVPKPICVGDDGVQSYIVLEYLDITGNANQRLLGEQLAELHQQTANSFGWQSDNTIGSTPQKNTPCDDWLSFWRDQRLGYQLNLAEQKGSALLQRLGEDLLLAMPLLIAGRNIDASMLHGDLWGGNAAGLSDGTPVIFDPAFYYGDRETDIAMTYLFGGFSADFYASYNNALPLDPGFNIRKNFYNLYHVINHFNLFGGGYQDQAVRMMQQLLAEIK